MAFNKKNSEFILGWVKKIKAVNLLGGKCEECGNNDVFCLEFHHSSDDKKFSISRLKNNRWSVMEKEINKCKLLCKNCHAELHCNSTSKSHNEKKQLVESIKKFKCEKCGYTGNNYASLDFHHLEKNNKIFRISDGLYGSHKVGVSIQTLMDEIKKCEVLCKNCHGKEHININKFNELKDIIIQKVETYKELQKPLDRNLVINMYNNCKNMHRVAKELHCARSTISMILKEYR